MAALALGLTGSVGFTADSHYYINDPLATTVAIADAAGEIAAIEADAFGAPLAAGEAPSRYTGKPYDADLGAFVFPFRNYRPEEGRWMSADPSGFPDGVNGAKYTPTPNIDVDPLGLLQTSIAIRTTDAPTTATYMLDTFWGFGCVAAVTVTYQRYTALTNDGSMTVNLYKQEAVSGGTWVFGYDYSYNCHGFVFAGSSYTLDPDQLSDQFMAAEGYHKATTGQIVTFGGFAHSAAVTSATEASNKLGLVSGPTTSAISYLEGRFGTAQYWE
jgi:RHS repeat-associated protein